MTANGRPLGSITGSRHGRNRRVSPVAPRPREGPLLNRQRALSLGRGNRSDRRLDARVRFHQPGADRRRERGHDIHQINQSWSTSSPTTRTTSAACRPGFGNIALARRFLGVPDPAPSSGGGSDGTENCHEDAEWNACPCCSGRMIIIETFEPGCQPRLWPIPSIGLDSS
jgi:hypothetical protein